MRMWLAENQAIRGAAAKPSAGSRIFSIPPQVFRGSGRIAQAVSELGPIGLWEGSTGDLKDFFQSTEGLAMLASHQCKSRSTTSCVGSMKDHGPEVLRTLRRKGHPHDVAEDGLQEALIEAFRHLLNGGEPLRKPEGAWLTMVAIARRGSPSAGSRGSRRPMPGGAGRVRQGPRF